MIIKPTKEQWQALSRLNVNEDFALVYDWLVASKTASDEQLYAAPTDRFANICIGEARTIAEILDVCVKAPEEARENATPPRIPETPD